MCTDLYGRAGRARSLAGHMGGDVEHQEPNVLLDRIEQAIGLSHAANLPVSNGEVLAYRVITGLLSTTTSDGCFGSAATAMWILRGTEGVLRSGTSLIFPSSTEPGWMTPPTCPLASRTMDSGSFYETTHPYSVSMSQDVWQIVWATSTNSYPFTRSTGASCPWRSRSQGQLFDDRPIWPTKRTRGSYTP